LASTSGAIAPEYGQQKLMWSETAVLGRPKDFDAVVPVPATDVPGGPKPSAHGSSRSPVHEVAVLAMPEKADVATADVVNLMDKMDASGRLRWQVPAGKCTILRFGYTPTGAKNPWGLFTDGMSAQALDKTWDVTIGPLLREMSPDERQGLYGVVDDSWEAGIATWTKLFPTEFQQRRGYDLILWLPALAGKNIGGAAAAEKARRDYCRTIADLIAQNHYSHLRDLAHRNGLILFAEAAGPNSAQLDGMKNSGNVDVPLGEFWIPSVHRPTPTKRFLLRDSASAAHIYGKRVIGCEAFTSIGPTWEESFFDLKNVGDQAFCDGCNLIVFHIQQGLFVADALYYRGDAIGQIEQMKTRPALPAEGYDHDNCNLDVLLHRLKVVDGRLVLPDGMNYRVLVIPDGTSLRPEAAGRIAALEKDGATVVRGDSIVASLGVPPDFEYTGLSDAGELDWIHRRAGEVDIYFVASRWDPKEKVACTFRVGGKQPELWDPVTGEIRDAVAFRQEDRRTTVPLDFNPRGSVFVVFRRPVTVNGSAASNYPTTQPLMEINGPWKVAFDPHWGGPATVTFDTLTVWTKRPEDGIRYYSGTAVYRNKFTLASVTGTLWLDLGEVHEIATVKLNGVDLGVVWTRPGRVDISRAVRAGANDLEITVVNLWPNRLIGDVRLPKGGRLTETNLHKFGAATPLYPSGLLGPVRVIVRSP
jgi:hypothetical protein